MAVKANYHMTMAKLWKHPKHGSYHVLWEETIRADQRKSTAPNARRRNTITRRKALCMPGSNRATKDLKLAKKLLNQFNQELMAGKVKSISSGIKVTWGDFKTEFLKYIEADRADGTYKLYKQALGKASDCWGDSTAVNHITGRHIDKLTSSLLLSGLSQAYVAKIYRHVKAALRKAAEWQYAKPMVFPKAPKVPEGIRYIPVTALSDIMGQIEDPEFYDFCILSSYLGLRSGETLRLRPDDVDNPEGFLRISSRQKNRKESRVPMTSMAREVVARCLERMEDAPKRKTLWRWTCITYMGQLFKKVVRAAGYETYRFHDLRHTFASYMAMRGEPLKVIQDLMRHKSITSTLVYAHLSPDHLIEAAERFTLGPMPMPKPKGK